MKWTWAGQECWAECRNPGQLAPIRQRFTELLQYRRAVHYLHQLGKKKHGAQRRGRGGQAMKEWFMQHKHAACTVHWQMSRKAVLAVRPGAGVPVQRARGRGCLTGLCKLTGVGPAILCLSPERKKQGRGPPLGALHCLKVTFWCKINKHSDPSDGRKTYTHMLH